MFGILKPPSPRETPAPRPVTPPPSGSMAPVPTAHFNSSDEVKQYAKDWAKTQGYAIVINRSRQNRLWLKCDRGGKYEDRHNLTEANRKRKRGESRLINCPFAVSAGLGKDGIWRVKTDVPEHNHGPTEDLTVHPSLRKLTEEQMKIVDDWTVEGKAPSEIMEELRRRWPEINVIIRDIYNARKKVKDLHKARGSSSEIDGQQVADSNGQFPGPTPSGKWVWAEAGQHLVKHGKKRQKKIAPLMESGPIDPQLQNGNNSHYSQDSDDALLQGLDFDHSYHSSAPDAGHQLSHVNTGASNAESADEQNDPFFRERRNSFPTASAPSQVEEAATAQTLRAEAATMVSPPRSTDSSIAAATYNHTNNSSSPKDSSEVQSGSEIFSRLEQMEREQLETKNMISQVLSQLGKAQSGA